MSFRWCRGLRVGFAPLLAPLLLAGCSLDNDVVARVGNRPIHGEDLLIVARQIGARYPGPPDSAKAHLLEDLVRRELLVQGAMRRGLQSDTVLLDQRRLLEEQVLRERLFADLGGTTIAVSEGEIQALHKWRDHETRARVIFSFSREGIEAAKIGLARGADFAALADRFNPPGFTPPGGDVGFVAPGFLLQPLDDVIRTSPIGRVVGPVEATGQGWFLVRVEERRARQNSPLEADRTLLSEVIRQRKQRRMMVRAFDRLTAEYQVEVVKGAPQELTMRVLNAGDAPPPPLTPGQQAMAMARYRGGVYTQGDAFQDLLSARNRPDFHQLASVERWLNSRALDRVLVLEARSHLYLSEPSVERSLREKTNDLLLQGFFTQEVVVPTQATEQDARALYQQTGQILELKQARILVVSLRDSAAAQQLALTARQSEGLREAVATAAPGNRVRSESLEFPTENPIWRALEPRLRSLEPGDYDGPFPTPFGWLVVQLVSKSQAAASYDGLLEGQKEMLLRQATELKRQQRLDELIASLRREIPVTIDWRRLKRLQWPEMVPALPQLGEG